VSSILFFDTETTGLPDEPNSKVIEVGYVVYDLVLGIVRMGGYLLKSLNKDELIDPSITAVNGICEEMIDKYGIEPNRVLSRVCAEMSRCDFTMAANFTFDQAMFERECKRWAVNVPVVNWMDFLHEIPYGPNIKGRSVNHIAADHGLANPFGHRAFTDALMMIQVIEKGDYDMEEVCRAASTPLIDIRSHQKFDDNYKAKAKGFFFDYDIKAWTRKIRQYSFQDFKESCDFEVSILNKKSEQQSFI